MSKTISNYSGPVPFRLMVALGLVPGVSIMNAMGERSLIQTTASGEDVWDGNDLAAAPTSHTTIPTPAAAGEQMSIKSESAADASAGTGVQTLRLHYLDAAGNQQTEDIIMNGTTLVDTTATDIRFINDMHSLTVGTGGVAAGHIFIHKTGTAGLVYNMISAGGNKSLVPNRMVPKGYKLVIPSWHMAETNNDKTSTRLRSTDMYGSLISGVYCFKDVEFTKNSSSGGLDTLVMVPGLSIVKVSAWAATVDAAVSCSWWGYLVSDS